MTWPSRALWISNRWFAPLQARYDFLIEIGVRLKARLHCLTHSRPLAGFDQPCMESRVLEPRLLPEGLELHPAPFMYRSTSWRFPA